MTFVVVVVVVVVVVDVTTGVGRTTDEQTDGRRQQRISRP